MHNQGRAVLLTWIAGVCLLPGCMLFPGLGKSLKSEGEGSLPASESAKLCQTVAESLAAQGYLAEAATELEKTRQLNPRADVSRQLARLYAQLGEDKRALAEFARATEAHPKDVDLWNDLGYYHYEKGRWTDAESALRTTVGLDPRHQRAWINLGLALGQQKRYPESLTAFEKAVKPAEARCNLAFVLNTQGKTEQARQLYREALQLDARCSLAQKGLARLEKQAQAGATAVVPQNGAREGQVSTTSAKPPSEQPR